MAQKSVSTLTTNALIYLGVFSSTSWVIPLKKTLKSLSNDPGFGDLNGKLINFSVGNYNKFKAAYTNENKHHSIEKTQCVE